jgi:formate/nitrite transporter FocA (FNT family)
MSATNKLIGGAAVSACGCLLLAQAADIFAVVWAILQLIGGHWFALDIVILVVCGLALLGSAANVRKKRA